MTSDQGRILPTPINPLAAPAGATPTPHDGRRGDLLQAHGLVPADLRPFAPHARLQGGRLLAVHRDAQGLVTGEESTRIGPRGQLLFGFTPGGRKALFRSECPPGTRPRLVLAAGALSAITLCALEDARRDTCYAAPGGCWHRAGEHAVFALIERGVRHIVLAFPPHPAGQHMLQQACTALRIAQDWLVTVEVRIPARGSWTDALLRARAARPAA